MSGWCNVVFYPSQLLVVEITQLQDLQVARRIEVESISDMVA